ncbi:hypothetical protein GJAV_G00001280 [Gymnothorax javanicus]|nr:hypothetical protein GJAV_G00001280 [Gymnothorax javanicus]
MRANGAHDSSDNTVPPPPKVRDCKHRASKLVISDALSTAVIPEPAAMSNNTFLDSEFRYSVFPVFYGLVFIFGLISNTLALFVLWKLRDTKALSEIRIYMMNLTVADLLFVLILPFWISYYAKQGDWIFKDPLCRITGSFFFVNTYTSVLFLAIISCNRYQAVTQPLSTRHPTTELQAPGEDTKTGVLTTHFIIVSIFFLAFILVLVCNILIARSLLAQRRTQAGRKHWGMKKYALWMVCLVVLVFVVCFVPHHVVQGPWAMAVLEIGDLSPETRQRLNDAHQFTTVLMGLNCILDPLVYCFSTRKFRRYLASQFQCLSSRRHCTDQTVSTKVSVGSLRQAEDAAPEA